MCPTWAYTMEIHFKPASGLAACCLSWHYIVQTRFKVTTNVSSKLQVWPFVVLLLCRRMWAIRFVLSYSSIFNRILNKYEIELKIWLISLYTTLSENRGVIFSCTFLCAVDINLYFVSHQYITFIICKW